MTENERPKSPAWRREADEMGAALAKHSAGPEVNADLCRAVIEEVFAYMGMELDEKAKNNLESYDVEKMRELMTKFRGMLQ